MQSRLQYHGGFFKLCSAAALMLAVFISVSVARAADSMSPTETTDAGTASTSNLMVPQSAVSSTYTLSAYDVVDVSIYNEEDLHTRAKLGSDGTVLLPLIGTVSLGGKTVAQANDLIQKRYAQGFVKDPHVLVTVLEYRKSTFSILGQVSKPGIYEIPEGTHMSIVDAILLAGGFTRIAAQNGVKVKRVVRGKPVVFKVKAGSMADSADVTPFEILPGDVIKVGESWF
jgi:protein involved in polysaccharide export with SLBB domain